MRSLTCRLLPGAMVSYGRRTNAAAIAATPRRTRGMIHQRLRRRGGRMGRRPPVPSPPASGPASTISSVVSGLMVSLAVVVAAILAVLVLVFSDQPATERVRGLRGGARNRRPETFGAGAQSPSGQAASAAVLRGPPPADVLQRQLALPSPRPRTSPPAAATQAATAARPASSSLATTTVADRAYDVRLGRDESITFLGRVRSRVALLVLLAVVGTTVALAIGLVLFLAGLALRQTLGW